MNFIKQILSVFIRWCKNPEVLGAFFLFSITFIIYLEFMNLIRSADCSELRTNISYVLNKRLSSTEYMLRNDKCYIKIEYDYGNMVWINEDKANDIIDKKLNNDNAE